MAVYRFSIIDGLTAPYETTIYGEMVMDSREDAIHDFLTQNHLYLLEIAEDRIFVENQYGVQTTYSICMPRNVCFFKHKRNLAFVPDSP
ncbi:hypothetical protein AN477_10900 [Alicyclobacillus ferrooxydans]|uniref:Uncharacterized protein n=1 Tax=Alicyclobacillus ferrooxydans TaxID=471514 RepID=A0A0P9EX30_9BACL|nr:hypothetical protein AN477_10900 [Alicyclobacillus ferrooxydans]